MAEKTKRSKGQYVHKNNKKPRKAYGPNLQTLRTSTKGIIVTANFLDTGCRRETFSLLDDFCKANEEKPVVSEDVDDEIAKEIAELNKKKKRFQIVDTTLNNFMFVAVRDDSLDVTELVHRILTTLRETKQRKTRFMQRILPVTHTCYASMEDIDKTAKIMLESIFYTKTPKTYGIIFKARNNSSIDRDAVIKSVATIATGDNEAYAEFNKVNLDNPEYTVLVNIVKTAVFMSVVKDFKLLSKYNIDELTKGFTDPAEGRVDKKTEETAVPDDKPETAVPDDKPETSVPSDDKPETSVPDDKPETAVPDDKPETAVSDNTPPEILTEQ